MTDNVTLPREVVEQVRGALAYVGAGNSSTNPNLAQSTCRQAIWKLDHALRAALEQPQNHVPDARNMVPAGWRLVPDEPTMGMQHAALISSRAHGPVSTKQNALPISYELVASAMIYRAMLAAAPQPPTTEDCSAVEQPQVEQEPAAWLHSEGKTHPLYLHTQPKREPLTDEQIKKMLDNCDDGQKASEVALAFARAIERAHGIGSKE